MHEPIIITIYIYIYIYIVNSFPSVLNVMNSFVKIVYFTNLMQVFFSHINIAFVKLSFSLSVHA